MVDKKSVNILIVDDDRDLCDTIVNLFKKTGMNIRGVYSAQEALNIINTEEVSILITDIRMPVKDGIYLLREVKKKNRQFPKVLFISGGSVDIETCYSLGVEGFFQKPFDIDEVKRVVMKCLLRKKDWLRLPLNKSRGRITKRFYDWDEMLKSKQVGFGKSGLFFSENYQFFNVGDLCDFKIQFVSGMPVKKIAGQGIVRWVRKSGDNRLSPGVGIEVVHIQDEIMNFYLDYIESLVTVSTIPSHGLDSNPKF